MTIQNGNLPALVVDVETALLQSDLRLETFWAALGRDIGATLRALTAPGRMQAMRRIAGPDPDLLPLRADAVESIEAAQAQGRQVILATDDRGMGLALARRLGLGADAVAGPGDVTDGAEPIPMPRDPRPCRFAVLLTELRPLQWIKNALLLFPLLAAHAVSLETVLPVLVAVAAFAAGASSLYILNDLMDLAADRSHPEKRHRPLAAGSLPIGTAMWTGSALLLVSLGLAGSVSAEVAGFLAIYLLLSLTYSLWLKHVKWIDLIALAVMFLLRVLTGGAAAEVGVLPTLLLFVAAVFFALASVKRLTGLSRLPTRSHLPGRGYGQKDRTTIAVVAGLSIALAVATFLAYASSAAALTLYGRPALFALVALPIGLWLVRMVWLSLQGREDFDTLRFVTRDRAGLAIIAVGLALTLLAIPV
ncbi:UbiA family prenyltransferase [Thalassovita aquimarina]|uniref:UbiA family prenyltransferase n=1 Tax=Thalassovita aquimarina TaxID=2785917 RepID=UPI003569A6FE